MSIDDIHARLLAQLELPEPDVGALEALLADAEAELGTDDVVTLQVRTQLGAALWLTGDRTAGERCMDRAIALAHAREPGGYDATAALRQKAELLLHVGETSYGLELLRQTLLQLQDLDDELAEIEELAVRLEVAGWLLEVGESDEAQAELTRWSEHAEEVLEPDDPDFREALSLQAQLTLARGEEPVALRQFRKFYLQTVRFEGLDSEAATEARRLVADFLGLAADPLAALDFLERPIQDSEDVLGADHPESLLLRLDQARLLGRADRTEEAAAVLDAVLAQEPTPENAEVLDLARAARVFQTEDPEARLELMRAQAAAAEARLDEDPVEALQAWKMLAPELEGAGRAEELEKLVSRARAADPRLAALLEVFLASRRGDLEQAGQNIGYLVETMGDDDWLVRTWYQVLDVAGFVGDAGLDEGHDDEDADPTGWARLESRLLEGLHLAVVGQDFEESEQLAVLLDAADARRRTGDFAGAVVLLDGWLDRYRELARKNPALADSTLEEEARRSRSLARRGSTAFVWDDLEGLEG